ncbi:hypothetical protein BCR42DRAFT_456953 [Absidia repens]|uniref:Heterokaryon incompatibility domain-containing protein n=1 Tax=Absidia repens TaxID=90262 RepID=A0A1X2HYF6_9FUNG|nr:hypothetical protein BCR42DRAFT_456953 [Absidia repens]
MTKDDIDEQQAEDKQSDTKRPFHVVLVDIKKAGFEKEIQCIEKPLEGTDDLKFVALSYRWGEVQEVTVDTQVGYTARITSFDIESFYGLCWNMAQERDLQHMEYVWVDAICVDQVNHARRKETIYHMTEIYERANYILAVPDMHLEYLKNVHRMNADIIESIRVDSHYIYYLLLGKMDELIELDHAFLKSVSAPDDPHWRCLLTNYTDHFADGFMTRKLHLGAYDALRSLDHIYDSHCATVAATSTIPSSSSSSSAMDHHHHDRKIIDEKETNQMITTIKDDLNLSSLHVCDDLATCPLQCFDKDMPNNTNGPTQQQPQQRHYHARWKWYIPERSNTIRRSMNFLADLVKDWASRVWVISEYHIAKTKKTNMKYWFIQLGMPWKVNTEVSFFEFDFHAIHPLELPPPLFLNRDAVHHTFHDSMRQQLNQQTFLEIMLKSKASKNEDRFYAVLPRSLEYKTQLSSKDVVSQWNITTLVSVKLQLYEWMKTEHQLELLFLSGDANHLGKTLPSFATTFIHWPEPRKYPTFTHHHDDDNDDDNGDDHYTYNFDMTNKKSITLLRQYNDDTSSYRLNIKPKEYYVSQYFQRSLLDGNYKEDKHKLSKHLHLDIQRTGGDLPDMIAIPQLDSRSMQAYRAAVNPTRIPRYICLIGCFAKNKWLLSDSARFVGNTRRIQWDHHISNGDELGTGFDIY